jgi:hypothetical protein
LIAAHGEMTQALSEMDERLGLRRPVIRNFQQGVFDKAGTGEKINQDDVWLAINAERILREESARMNAVWSTHARKVDDLLKRRSSNQSSKYCINNQHNLTGSALAAHAGSVEHRNLALDQQRGQTGNPRLVKQSWEITF